VIELRGLDLHFDCFAGIAGDMTLGALFDAGVPEAVVREELARLPLRGYELTAARAVRGGLEGVDVKVRVEGHDREHEDDHDHDHDHDHEHEHDHEHDHDHDHDHHHQHGRGSHGHRAWAEIRGMLEAHLGGEVRRRALDMFGRVAAAEAKLHGRPVEEIAFHEVGAIDSIVDTVGVAAALAWLRPRRITARAVPLGHGFVQCAHGRFPVPSPAALEILRGAGAPVEDGAADMELTTPTGAAILAASVEAFGPLPPLVPRAIGYGAGDDDPPGRPNLLRVILGAPLAAAGAGTDEVALLEANVDDMPAELCEPLLEALFAAGARDAWLAPIVMKKSRPAMTVAALCPPAARDAVAQALLTHSTTIGVRMQTALRRVLDRRTVDVETEYGTLPIKLALDGPAVLNAAPEYEPCRAAARAHGVPLKEVYAAVVSAYRRAR
jgi:hypothetical protein